MTKGKTFGGYPSIPSNSHSHSLLSSWCFADDTLIIIITSVILLVPKLTYSLCALLY